jgi:uncharacterized pyridoxal phosphate-containing UPF0001 family protein
LPSDIRWHLVGHLQSNKVKDLIGFFIIILLCVILLLEGCPNLFMIETLDSSSLADKIQKRLIQYKKILNYMIEVRTSSEESVFN